MPSKAEAFRNLGQQYMEYLDQFRQFTNAIAKSVDADSMPSFSLISNDDEGFRFSYLGRDYGIALKCFARNDLTSPQGRIDPYIFFHRDDKKRTFSLDKDGNVTPVESENIIGNIQKDPTDVFFIVLASVARD